MDNATRQKRLQQELDSLRDPALGYVRAGRPRYERLFGRDSLVVAWQRLEREPEIAVATLRLLASMQGRKENPTSEEEPGKILHEWAPERVPWVRWDFPYYGSVDATPLFVLLAAWTRHRLDDPAPSQELWPSVKAACGWIVEKIIHDPNGFLSYAPANPEGLRHQGWKDGRDLGPAPYPVAIVEAQGYAYSALIHAADCAAETEPDLAALWRQTAQALRSDFNEAFWLPEEKTYALAIQGDGSPCRAVTSNPGHLLFTGIVEENRLPLLVERLSAEDLWTPYGIRTLSAEDRAFKADSYHHGSIWPHDNWIISEGLRALGYTKERARLRDALLAADDGLGKTPELFAVHLGKLEAIPFAQYPQAWSSGALLNLLDSSLDERTALRILPPSAR